MIKQLLHLLLPLSLFIILSIFGGCHSNPFRVKNISREPAQDIESALNYLDLRNKDWLKGIHENNGSCLSCHTTLSYSLVRPSFGQSEELTRMREMIEKRVEIYTQGGLIGDGANQMWYPETIQESLSNEAVLNAVTLVYMDKGKEKGTEKLKSSTKKALDLMWKRQEVAGDLKGGFKWLDYFGLRPFEAKGAGYWGAAMVAVAVGEAPENYKNNPAIQENLKELKKYLKTNLANETLHNQLMVVWANQALDGTIISQAKVKEITTKVLKLQKEGGGWSIHSLFGETAHPVDGYATGMVTNIMMKAGLGANPKVRAGMNWIRTSQSVLATGVLPSGEASCGSWYGSSLNHNAQTLFMTDLSTSYAMLALKTAKQLGF